MENGGSSTAVVEKAELQINKIEEELSAIAAAAKASIREYASEQANGYMTVDIQSEEKQIAEAWQDAVRKTLAFWIVSNLVLFLFEVKREKSMRRNRK